MKMITRSRFRVRTLQALLLVSLLLGVPPVSAEDDVRRGVSMVSEVDYVRKRITLDEQVYRVTDKTQIQRFDGVVAQLSDVRTPKRGSRELLPITSVDFVRFVAERTRGGWALQSLTILDGPVE